MKTWFIFFGLWLLACVGAYVWLTPSQPKSEKAQVEKVDESIPVKQENQVLKPSKKKKKKKVQPVVEPIIEPTEQSIEANPLEAPAPEASE